MDLGTLRGMDRFDRLDARVLILAAVVLYAVSLALPSFYCFNGPLGARSSQGAGIVVLLFGWMGVANREIRWVANLFFFAVVWMHFVRAPRDRGIWLGTGGILAAFVLWLVLAPIDGCEHSLGNLSTAELGQGGKMWVASLAAAALSCIPRQPLRAGALKASGSKRTIT